MILYINNNNNNNRNSHGVIIAYVNEVTALRVSLRQTV